LLSDHNDHLLMIFNIVQELVQREVTLCTYKLYNKQFI